MRTPGLRTRRSRWLALMAMAIVVVVLAVSLLGQHSRASQIPSGYGLIEGRLLVIPATAPPPNAFPPGYAVPLEPVSGSIELRSYPNTENVVATATAGADGRFVISAKSGEYAMFGLGGFCPVSPRSEGYSGPAPFHLDAGAIVHRDC